MKDGKVFVMMTVSGKVKEYTAVDTIREVLESVREDYMRAGSGWDRPDRLFIDGKCIVDNDLAGIAYEYGEFRNRQDEMIDKLLDGWIDKRFDRATRGDTK